VKSSSPKGGNHDSDCSLIEAFLDETLARQRGVSRHTRQSYAPSRASNCSSSTIGAPRRSPPIKRATCSKSSRIATTKGSLIITSQVPVDRWQHPEQGFRTCLGILRSYRGLDPVRLEAVSARAVELGVLNYKGVASLLARKPDRAAAKDSRPATLFDHANLRGPGYYH
jgi:hypothetical protein